MDEIKSKTKHAKPKSISSFMPQLLTCILSAMLSIMIFILAFKDIIETNKEAFTLILGGLMGLLSSACSFWFERKGKNLNDEENKVD